MYTGGANQVNLQPQTTDPQPGSPAEDRRSLVNAVRSISHSGQWPGRELAFHVDPLTHRFTVEVLNSETGEILEQIPSEEVLKMAAKLNSKDVQS